MMHRFTITSPCGNFKRKRNQPRFQPNHTFLSGGPTEFGAQYLYDVLYYALPNWHFDTKALDLTPLTQRFSTDTTE